MNNPLLNHMIVDEMIQDARRRSGRPDLKTGRHTFQKLSWRLDNLVRRIQGKGRPGPTAELKPGAYSENLMTAE